MPYINVSTSAKVNDKDKLLEEISNLIDKYFLEIDCNVSIALLSLGAIMPIVIQSALKIFASSSSKSFFY